MKFAAKTAILISGAVLLSIGLVGCQGGGIGWTVSSSDSPETSQTTEPSVVTSGQFDATASALDNMPAFETAVTKGAAANTSDTGKNLVNALVAAGFPKEAMQVTFNKTKTGQDADSVIVSVMLEDSCLIGQRTPDGNTFTSLEQALATGGCLIGITRQIDW